MIYRPLLSLKLHNGINLLKNDLPSQGNPQSHTPRSLTSAELRYDIPSFDNMTIKRGLYWYFYKPKLDINTVLKSFMTEHCIDNVLVLIMHMF
jgi:hypothetical protein